MTHLAFVQPLYDEDEQVPDWERPSAVVGVYVAAPKPKWTTEPPTHEGWFFVRPSDRSHGVPERVMRNPGNGVLVWGSTELPWRPVRMEGLCWSDRAIQEPVP